MSQQPTEKVDDELQNSSNFGAPLSSESKHGRTSVDIQSADVNDVQPPKKTFRFWLIILSLMFASYILAVDLVCDLLDGRRNY